MKQLILPSPVEMEGLKNYNNFFHPNLCHVCKTTVQKVLRPCSNCGMISYCSDEHRSLHWSQHQRICEAIRELSQTWGLKNTRGKLLNEWVNFKKTSVLKIAQILGHELEPYEEQMFMFAKSCLVCHQQNNLIITCEECFSVNSCSDHNLHCVKHDCASLKLSLILDINYLPKEQFIRSFSFYHEINIVSFPFDIVSFLVKFTMEEKYRCAWNLFDYYYSDWVSEVLTMCQIMLNVKYKYLINKKDFFVIHIISGHSTNLYDWLAWEILLHLLGPKITIKIIVVDANSLSFDTGNLQVCYVCNQLDKKISIHCRSMPYEDYVQSELHEQADVIIGYQADLTKFGQRAILALYSQKCPLILTTTSKKKTEDNVKKLQNVLGFFGMHFMSVKNSFQSLRPYRDYENNHVFISNQYLTICDNPNFFNDSVQ